MQITITYADLEKFKYYAQKNSINIINTKYENNIVTNIPSIKLQSIAKVLEVSPAYLMGWENELADDTADLLPDLLSDKVFWENIKKLKQLNKEHQQTIFDNITYWYEKEGH